VPSTWVTVCVMCRLLVASDVLVTVQGSTTVPIPVRTGAEVWVNGCSDPR
jgi:hypothetical protein